MVAIAILIRRSIGLTILSMQFNFVRCDTVWPRRHWCRTARRFCDRMWRNPGEFWHQCAECDSIHPSNEVYKLSVIAVCSGRR